MTENERFGLVFVKTGSINSGTAVCSEYKAADRAVCAIGNCFPTANQKTRRPLNIKGHSQEGGWANFSKNLRASLFNK